MHIQARLPPETRHAWGRSRLHQVGLGACLEHVRLRTPKLGEDAPLVGAAELAFERLLADPLDAA